jgi:hypothetical protein
MEDYDLVTNNNLIIQALIDDLPVSIVAENIMRATVTNLRSVTLRYVFDCIPVNI